MPIHTFTAAVVQQSPCIHTAVVACSEKQRELPGARGQRGILSKAHGCNWSNTSQCIAANVRLKAVQYMRSGLQSANACVACLGEAQSSVIVMTAGGDTAECQCMGDADREAG